MATYVIESWRASDQPDANNNYVAITGRKEGFISWLLGVLRINPTVSITVSANRLEFSEGSLSGNVHRYIPLPGICSTRYGYEKPWKHAVTMAFVLFFLMNVLSARGGFTFVSFVATLLIIGVCVLYYFLSRRLTLGFVEHSGVVSSIQFKPSIVGNQDINEAQAGYVCQLIQSLGETRAAAAWR